MDAAGWPTACCGSDTKDLEGEQTPWAGAQPHQTVPLSDAGHKHWVPRSPTLRPPWLPVTACPAFAHAQGCAGMPHAHWFGIKDAGEEDVTTGPAWSKGRSFCPRGVGGWGLTNPEGLSWSFHHPRLIKSGALMTWRRLPGGGRGPGSSTPHMTSNQPPCSSSPGATRSHLISVNSAAVEGGSVVMTKGPHFSPPGNHRF